MRRSIWVSALALTAIACAPLFAVSTEDAYSAKAIKDCMGVTDRFSIDKANYRTLEASTSFAVEPYASQAEKSPEALAAISEGGAPTVLGVFLTIRAYGKDVEASCQYSAARGEWGFKGAMLDSMSLDYLPVAKKAGHSWPVFSTGYIDRWAYFWPLDVLVVTK